MFEQIIAVFAPSVQDGQNSFPYFVTEIIILMKNRFLFLIIPTLLCSYSCKSKSAPDDYVPLPENVSVRTLTYAVKGENTLQLDFYRDTTLAGKLPTYIYVHGGSWAEGTRKDAKWIGRVAKHGLNAVSISYRLDRAGKELPDTTKWGAEFSQAIRIGVEDLYDATAYLLENEDKLGVDREKVIISGGSAGATNSIMAEYWLCNHNELATTHLPEGFRYAAVIPWAGAVWKIGMDTPHWDEEPCPHMFCHGTKDWVVPFWDTMIPASNFGAFGPETLSRIFKENGWAYETLFVEESDHYMAGGPDFSITAPSEKVDYTGQMLDFIDRFVLDGQRMQIESLEKDLDEVRDLKHIIAVNIKDTMAGRKNAGKLPDYSKGADIVVETVDYAVKGTDTLRMDIYRDPSFTGPRPVILYSLTGGWEGGTRKDMAGAFFRPMAAKGYVIVSIDYRLDEVPEFAQATVDAIEMGVEDLYDATAYLVKNAKRLYINPKQIIAMGASAGAMNVLTAEYWRANGKEMAKKHLPKGFAYAAVVPCAGALWLPATETIAWKSTPSPIVFFHGTKDSIIPYSEVQCTKAGIKIDGPEMLVPSLKEAKASYVLYSVEGGDHLQAAQPSGYLNTLLDGLLRRLVLMDEKVQIRFDERSLDTPHTAEKLQ